jgi:PHD/YefM family antitoxin component YafN of YafNO toxin-antitoxin module
VFYDVTETQVQVLAIVTKADAQSWLDEQGTPLRLAVNEEIVITRHGRPAGVLIGFASEEDWFEYRLEHHPEFLRRIEDARLAIRAGQGIPLRDLE